MFNTIESLENRRLFATQAPTFELIEKQVLVSVTDLVEPTGQIQQHLTKNGTLLIEGSRFNDTITLTTTVPKNLVVVHGAVGATDTDAGFVYVVAKTRGGEDSGAAGYNLAHVKRIQIEGGAGNDDIRIGIDVKRKATLIGAKGNDNLVGGALGDVISGGEGNDTISAAEQTMTFTVFAVPKLTEPKPVGGKLFIPGTTNTTNITGRLISVGGQSERADSADLLEGGAGDDVIRSGKGPDTVNGGAGTDQLIAGDRGKAPQNLTTAADTPVDYNGLTVISIEKANVDGITLGRLVASSRWDFQDSVIIHGDTLGELWTAQG